MTFRPTRRLREQWERTPLRVRLVASLMSLLTVALVLTSVVNLTALSEHLTEQVDEDLRERLSSLDVRTMTQAQGNHTSVVSQYVVYMAVDDDAGAMWSAYSIEQIPALSAETLYESSGRPFTAPSADNKTNWRVLSSVQPDGAGSGPRVVLAIATPISDVESAIVRLMGIGILVGAAVLAGMAGIGVALVRAALNPLKAIEHTATSIAAGDMSRRVPQWDPRTEVGRLGSAINVMLGQIESALAAREASEERALASEERMRRFIADASHELRTPLTTVRGFSELYRHRGEVPPDEAAELMRRIEAEAIRMGLLVEDLLLLARLDRQRPLERHPVDLLSVAADTVSAAQVIAEGRTIELYTEGGPFLVRGDDMRLRQVLSNLVTNAIRHTPTTANVEVGLHGDGEYVEMTVRDNGPGMTAEQTDRVFERFYRADKARSRSAGGTGLGLAIVAALVAAHNGEVSARSAPGEGAEFTVRLALDPDVHSRMDDSADEASADSDDSP